jgi:hypothetical protein
MKAGHRGSAKLTSEFCFFVTLVGIHRNDRQLEGNVRSERGEAIAEEELEWQVVVHRQETLLQPRTSYRFELPPLIQIDQYRVGR